MYIKGPYYQSSKHNWIWLSLSLLIIGIVPLIVLLADKPYKLGNNSTKPAKKPLTGRVVIIDPGHGGSDPGACRAGVMEKDINLAIAKMVARGIASAGGPVHLTRETDKDFTRQGVYTKAAERYDLNKRIQLAKSFGGEIYVSVHVNAGPGEHSGAEVYYDPRRESSFKLASLIQEELNNVPGMPFRKPRAGQYYLFDNIDIPAVIVETGWICNNRERKMLQDPVHQARLAKAIERGILNFSRTSK
ncbi:cell wall hydrolase/autolysin [Desulfotomaculum nigrificans CO-1-SRB]|uniref:Cell wall hydrolase/autolysin n=1 Tax=Desulfotomaculum nigrificans (strain DSM 14880 / VKM B-2319 / CO-1-SRB) TaxID=868595 RepID=F6B8I2_DESCC|nr:N-acetylmuramoyl-L-alanine amidase [Desulfotomaculum nigrificans]AEF93554.1 cell wall hydrolase/autolysin [Desulfotomaculum nigrificans CO-1-SRB]